MSSRTVARTIGSLETRTAPVWRALADPTRRRVLDLLLDGPRITGDISSHFRISRIAVMRHLEVLSGAGLVVSRKRGRERRYYLNAIPLQDIYRRWFDPQAAGWAAGMLRFRSSFEGKRTSEESAKPAVDIALDVRIDGPPAAVFKALTVDADGWWGHPMLRPQATGLTLERRLGGLFIEQWGDDGAVLAVVSQWAKDRHLELMGPFHLGLGVGVASFDLAADREGTRLQFSFRAFGPIDPDRAMQFSKGWTELVTRRLKALVEHGTRLGIAPETQAPIKPGRRRRSDA
jgi:DNA-binding transcriptional ArsR family regulator/uncharacterized protein YndB with AHSA1/START domain